VRYKAKLAQKRAAAVPGWLPTGGQGGSRALLVGFVAFLLVLGMVGISALSGDSPAQEQSTRESQPSPTLTATPGAVLVVVPPTATPSATFTPFPTVRPTDTAEPLATPTLTPSPTLTPLPTLTLMPPPKIIGPKDGLVWHDGAIVFEFEELNLADDELYCLNTLRGFDLNNTENWSYLPTGNKSPSIPIEANVFRIAKIQGMRCIVWSASIGKGSCDDIISQSTEERIIGLPRPCIFD
jgi:hypothetical protein